MSADFMERWLTLWIIWSVAIFPVETVLVVTKLLTKVADTDFENLPDGCAITIAVLVALALIAAPFLGWWCYHNFHVVWK